MFTQKFQAWVRRWAERFVSVESVAQEVRAEGDQRRVKGRGSVFHQLGDWCVEAHDHMLGDLEDDAGLPGC